MSNNIINNMSFNENYLWNVIHTLINDISFMNNDNFIKDMLFMNNNLFNNDVLLKLLTASHLEF